MGTPKGVYAALAQPDRVPGYEPVGRGFESLMPRHKKESPLGGSFFVPRRGGEGEKPRGRFVDSKGG